MKKIIINALCMFLAVGSCLAQEDADSKYHHMGYMAYVNDVQPGEDAGAATAVKVANSYRLNGNSEAAAFWYARALQTEQKPELMLNYAHALLSSGNCEEAVAWYQKYQEASEDDEEGIRTFIQNCGAIRANKVFGEVEVKAVEGINTQSLDFSPIPVEGGLVFTSTRRSDNPILHNDMWTAERFMDLYFVPKKEDGTWGKSKKMFGSVNGKRHDGVATFVAGGEKMFFSRNNLKGKNKKDSQINLKIYQAQKTNDYWGKSTELPFNSDDYSTCHPTLSNAGTVMVFASDRPGGFGGMDLYYTTWAKGTWSKPMNLGAGVNTSGNEIFPFLDSKNRLFFSSDGRAGLGGLDLFISENLQEVSWGEPQNLGGGMNSQKDDFGVWVSPEGNSGYFSSNRTGGLGGDDIYEWTSGEGMPKKAPAKKSVASGVMVVDAKTQMPIEGASVAWVEMTQASGIILNEMMENTPNDGKISFPVLPGRTYAFNVKKSGYTPKNVNASVEVLKSGNGTWLIPIEKEDMVTMSGVVTNAITGSMVSSADVTMKNLCDNSIEVYRSDINGNFNFETKCGCSYEMTARKNGFIVATKTISNTCTPETVRIALATEEVAPAPGTTTLTEGQVLVLKDVYYDYDKWFIRSDAAVELDKLVSIMNQYPSLEVELGSHTDSRGKDEYNQRLSQKRANSAVDYIISKGVSSSRITARGYGETVLVNECANGVECSDEKHQENRRTEVRITKLDSNVKVIYEH